MKITENILAILAKCRIEGNAVFLPPEQFDRATYTAVNKVLENIGGKWNRSAKGHIYDPTEGFDNLLVTGEAEDMKKTFQFFPTPRLLAEKLVKMAEFQLLPYREHCPVLEPSAGNGAIADVIQEELKRLGREGCLICVEVNEQMKKFLDEKPYTTMYCDFLSLSPKTVKPFDRIVMNPPFTRLQDVDHVLHAYSLLATDGILVSVMSVSPFFRQDKKSKSFMEFLEIVGADVKDVPSGAFAESGTQIATKIVKIRKALSQPAKED